MPMAQWQSGYAADCKSVYVGSIPACASSKDKALGNESLFFFAARPGLVTMGIAASGFYIARYRSIIGAAGRRRTRRILAPVGNRLGRDRKSTRLNSSH